MPEKGARLILAALKAGNQVAKRAVLAYYSRGGSDRIEQYDEGVGLFHELKEGEWDDLSWGVAYVKGDRQGRLHLRGGIIQGLLDPQRLLSKWRAPTHTRQMHANKSTELGDEERLGVVNRTKSDNEQNRWIKSVEDNANWAKEHLLFLNRGTKRLVAMQEGDCIDDDGDSLKHTKTKKRLRFYKELYDEGGSLVHREEIDTSGNILVEGDATRIDLVEQMAKVKAQLARLEVLTSKAVSISAQTSATMEGGTTARLAGRVATRLGPDEVIINQAVLGTYIVEVILNPLILSLSNHFTEASKPPTGGPGSFSSYQTYMAQLALDLQKLPPLLKLSLSKNVWVSQ